MYDKIAVKKYRRTQKGFFTQTYANNKKCNIYRFGTLPEYSKEELVAWFHAQDNFEEMFMNWKKSKYNIDLKPSTDRIDDYLPYSISNIQLTTWEENREKGHKSRVSGTNNKQNQKILKRLKNGDIESRYFSIAHAARENNLDQGSISKCCAGKLKTVGGFHWELDGNKTVRIKQT